MEALLPVVVGVLYASGFYLIQRHTLGQLIVGLALLTNATNLLIFTAGGLSRGGAPLVPDGSSGIEGAVADPVPQALVLTAIVIGFGVLAFFIALAYRAYRAIDSDALDDLTTTDRLDEPAEDEPAEDGPSGNDEVAA